MTINLLSEQLMSMAQAVRSLPMRTSGKRLHVGTLYRWASQGVKGTRLETVRIGEHRFTSAEALQRFVDRLTEAAELRAAQPLGTDGAHQLERERVLDRELSRRLASKKT